MLDIEKITSSGTEEEKAIVEKVRKGEKLSEEEVHDLRLMCFDYDREFKEIEGDSDRWTKFVTGIFSIGSQYYCIGYELGLTECDENFYGEQKAEKIEVKKGYIKAVSYGGAVQTEGDVLTYDDLVKAHHN